MGKIGIVINDMVIRYGESLWPRTSPRPGENGSYENQPDLLEWVGGWVANPSLLRPRVE